MWTCVLFFFLFLACRTWHALHFIKILPAKGKKETKLDSDHYNLMKQYKSSYIWVFKLCNDGNKEEEEDNLLIWSWVFWRIIITSEITPLPITGGSIEKSGLALIHILLLDSSGKNFEMSLKSQQVNGKWYLVYF